MTLEDAISQHGELEPICAYGALYSYEDLYAAAKRSCNGYSDAADAVLDGYDSEQYKFHIDNTLSVNVYRPFGLPKTGGDASYEIMSGKGSYVFLEPSDLAAALTLDSLTEALVDEYADLLGNETARSLLDHICYVEAVKYI